MNYYDAPKRRRHGGRPPKTWQPKIETPPERLAFLEERLPVIGRYRNAHEKSPLTQELKDELRDSRKWIQAGIRQAEGKVVSTGTVPGQLPSEGVVIEKAYESACAVDELIERCEEALGRTSEGR
ncbi:hypothetical protein [Paramicrobacterium fandaimingii]|uniref:hypothetical protein n=1 Tax=Paramicrobacterium fandaimingii TaxID=2708079 RepID=UPI001420DD37|nr:hypothetical protein [Microbacterium fandaimingii]